MNSSIINLIGLIFCMSDLWSDLWVSDDFDLMKNWFDIYGDRYKIYIEGWAWSVSEKYILACDSMTLLITPRYYDFFIRGMAPSHHYWPIRGNTKCTSLKFAVQWGNNHTLKVLSLPPLIKSIDNGLIIIKSKF